MLRTSLPDARRSGRDADPPGPLRKVWGGARGDSTPEDAVTVLPWLKK